MGLIDDLNAIIDANLPDNSSQLITEVKMRDTLKALTASFEQLLPVYMRVNLGGADFFTTNALKVATDTLLVINEGVAISNAPVNDDADPVRANWPYPGGASPMSWSHDQVSGTLYLPVEMDEIEIYIRPVL